MAEFIMRRRGAVQEGTRSAQPGGLRVMEGKRGKTGGLDGEFRCQACTLGVWCMACCSLITMCSPPASRAER